MLKDSLYKYNQYVCKVYGFGKHKQIKLIRMNCLRTAELEYDQQQNYHSERCAVNDTKLDESIARTRSKIFELAFCNPWQWFFTATLDGTKYDRTDLDKFHKDLSQFIRNYNKRNGLSIKWLLIPELHNDGVSWHMHGFLYDLPVEHLKKFEIGDRMGKALADKVKRGDEVYNWLPYMMKFGFCDLEPIKNPAAVSKYVTKYISKKLATSVTELNAHMYYHSRGLNTAELIAKGYMPTPIDIQPEQIYHNDYCDIMWYKYDSQTLQKITDAIVSD